MFEKKIIQQDCQSEYYEPKKNYCDTINIKETVKTNLKNNIDIAD